MTHNQSQHRRNTWRGFTLVELLVASAIFSTVLIIAIGALFSAQIINTRLQETQIILDGVNLATEVISRDVRYGSEFYCESATPTPITTGRLSCAYPAGGAVLVFKPTVKLKGTPNADLDRVAYYSGDITINGNPSGVIYKAEYPGGDVALSRIYQVTPTDVNVQSLTFFTHGVNSSSGAIDVGNAFDYDQPSVTMSISGVTIPSRQNVDPVTFNVQTSISSRGLDN